MTLVEKPSLFKWQCRHSGGSGSFGTRLFREARQHSHLPLHALWILQTPTRDLFDLKHREVEKI